MTDEQVIQPEPEDPCKELRAKAEEYLSGWQRERADFQNYRKDESRRIEEAHRRAIGGLLLELLPVLDSFDMAFDFMPQEEAAARWAKGMEQVRFQLLDALKREGIEPMHVEEGKTVFDPQFHEAMEEAESEKPEGTVLAVMQKGYAINGRVIRPARVRVA
ncbi:MAG: nucleotide exchange factor GrpE, partial [bacterium]|nr:nucleotide exchange factor GrpE [bacterium]